MGWMECQPESRQGPENGSRTTTSYLKDELFNMTRAWDKEKSEFPTGTEPISSRTPGGRSIHSATRTHGEHRVHMWQVSCIPLGSALPNSSWVVISLPGVQEVMGSIPVGDSNFSLSHARVMLNISSFTSNYRAQNTPPSFTYHSFVYLLSVNSQLRILHF